jgi:hypothetical protein
MNSFSYSMFSIVVFMLPRLPGSLSSKINTLAPTIWINASLEITSAMRKTSRRRQQVHN